MDAGLELASSLFPFSPSNGGPFVLSMLRESLKSKKGWLYGMQEENFE